MPPPIYLVGYDGSAASAAAVRSAITLAVPTGAVVLAAHVLAEQLGPDAWAAAHIRAQKLLAGAGEGVTRHCVVEGPAAHGLHDLAIDVRASLLFVGATHRGAFGRMVPGSVGERLIHGAPCPLVVVPTGTDGPVATIGVGFDDRDESRCALRLACAIALEQQAQLVLLTVLDPPSSAGRRRARPGDDATAHATRISTPLVATTTALIPAEIVVEHRALTGPAGPTLVSACSDDIDLLVVGSRGYGPLHSVLAGSVARHLADHASCPVLIVPRAHEPKRHRRGAAAASTSAA